MSTPGVGVIVALTYVAAIDDPGRFRSSKAVGAHFGLTPKKYQSGETDVTGRISKIGDASVRTALYEAASVILTRPVKGSLLKSWAMRLAFAELLAEDRTSEQQRVGHRDQGRMPVHQFANPAFKAARGRRPYLQAKAAQDPSQAHLQVMPLALNQLACGQQGAQLLGR